MQVILQVFSKRSLSFIVILLLLVSPTLSRAAEKKEKPSAAKQTKSKPVASRRKPAAKAAPKIDETTVHASFDTFTQEWMTKLAEAEEYHRTQQIKVTPTPDGFSAEYTGYLSQRFIEVKKTEYQDTPFVGTLTYYERTLRCTGKTKEEALQGPFEQAETSPVREIFRFTKGKWVY